MFRNCVEVPRQSFGRGIMAASNDRAVFDVLISSAQPEIHAFSDARDLIYHFIIKHLVLGVRSSVRTKKHAHDIVSVSFYQALLDQAPREFADAVQPGAESAILARGQVPDIFKQSPWDVLPGLLEDEVVPRRVERGIDAIDYWTCHLGQTRHSSLTAYYHSA